MKIPLIFFLVLLGVGCGSTECLNTKVAKGEKSEISLPTAVERVKVYRPDGSLQCGQGETRSLDQDKKDLKNIRVFEAVNKNDGQMRIQVCGAPTGNSNIFEIAKIDLDAALKLGFKHWVFE